MVFDLGCELIEQTSGLFVELIVLLCDVEARVLLLSICPSWILPNALQVSHLINQLNRYMARLVDRRMPMLRIASVVAVSPSPEMSRNENLDLFVNRLAHTHMELLASQFCGPHQ